MLPLRASAYGMGTSIVETFAAGLIRETTARERYFLEQRTVDLCCIWESAPVEFFKGGRKLRN